MPWSSRRGRNAGRASDRSFAASAINPIFKDERGIHYHPAGSTETRGSCSTRPWESSSPGFWLSGTLIILKLVDLTIGLRVTEDEESKASTSQHGEEGYSWEVTA